MSVDRYLSRRRGPGYDCLDFAREVWLGETGEDLGGRADPRLLRQRRRLAAPEHPCLVLMRARGESHLGVYLRGRVAHLRDVAEFQPLEIAAFGFRRVEFYR